VVGIGFGTSKGDVISGPNAIKIGRKTEGMKLGIIDEINMVAAASIHDISERMNSAKLAMTNDEQQREYIHKHHFGGVHMIFSGDLYQLKPVAQTSIYVSNPSKRLDKMGRLIWEDINEFEELTENCR
jgi:hypothetical protein